MPPPAPPQPPDRRGGDGIPVRGPSPADHPRVLAGRYRLDSVIGKGSMGTVWAATDEILHRQVAIKEIDFPPGTPAAERAQLEHRTLREARAIAALSNPYVITLFDILTLEQGPVIVMELLRARSLAEILRKVGRLPDGQAATIGVAVASGLLAAHAAGITHRDVKPGNVLICDDGRIKLTDFGIARSTAEQTMTATGLLLGSPAYIAPEVASGVPVGPISDAWSLGGLLFATVEGRPPFDQGTAIATLTSVVKDPVPPHPHSGRLGAVVSGLLVKTPALRMRIDRALVIMRGIADDPSGMNLAAVQRIPRDEDTAPALPTASGATGGTSSGPGVGGPAGASGVGDRTGASGVGDRTGASGTGNRSGASGAGDRTGGSPGVDRGRPGILPGSDRGQTSGRAVGSGSTPYPPARYPADQPPRHRPGSPPPGAYRTGSTPGYATGSTPGSTGSTPWSTGSTPRYPGGSSPSYRTGSTPPPGLGPVPPRAAAPRPAVPPLPPPPWAQSESAALPPLPADDPDRSGADSDRTTGKPTGRQGNAPAQDRSRVYRVLAAVLVGIVAAAAGYFGVRIIADLATESAAPISAAVQSVSAAAWTNRPPA
ncbi:protein kinase domain-containing protein [Nakamurella sp. GG22]